MELEIENNIFNRKTLSHPLICTRAKARRWEPNMKKFKLVIMLIIIVTLTACIAAKTVDARNKNYTLMIGEKQPLKVDTNKEIKWSSSKRSIATVNSKGMVTARKVGTAIITATVGNKKYEFDITITKATKAIVYAMSPSTLVTPIPTSIPEPTDISEPTAEPTITPSPTSIPTGIPTPTPILDDKSEIEY